MIYHNVPQNSPEWYALRLGIATTSCFDKIITPKTRKMSSQADEYANRLIAELITGEGQENFPKSYWMERGALMEIEARGSYEIITDLKLDRGGFTTNNAGTRGSSPDVRVLNEDGHVVGAAEIKCPSPTVHVSNLLRMAKHGAIDPEYIPQVQGQMHVLNLDWIDWFSYHPEMPPALIRTPRDAEFQEALEKCLNEFDAMMAEKIETLRKRGIRVPPRPEIKKPETHDVYMAG